MTRGASGSQVCLGLGLSYSLWCVWSAKSCDFPVLGLRGGQECSWLKGDQSTRTDQSRGFFCLLQNLLLKYSGLEGLKTAQTLPPLIPADTGDKPCSRTGEPFLEELPVPLGWFRVLGPAAERSPAWLDNPLKQPLVAAALGEAAALSFPVHVFPPHKSNRGMEIKGKQPEGWKRSWKRLQVRDGHTVGFWGADNFLIWMEVQSGHFTMII